MKHLQKIQVSLALVLALAMLQGCFIFRRKNRCNTCPNFHSEVVQRQDRG